jgi:uncharacterized protein (TIGR02452 family)
MYERYKKIADDTIEHIWSDSEALYTEYISKLTKYYPEGELNFDPDDPFHFKKSANIIVEKITSLEAIYKYTDEINGTVVLNFASAKHPGGGFLNGAVAQEESLARSSNLYPSLLEQTEFYQNNEAPYYNDKIIYTPDVLFFKDDNGNYVAEEKRCSVITCAAPNLNGGNYDIETVRIEFVKRIEKVLQVAILNEEENIILGAWGCGVFRNPPDMVADCFATVLNILGYKDFFKNIIFAIPPFPDDKNYQAFKNIL